MSNIVSKNSRKNKLNLLVSALFTAGLLVSSHAFAADADVYSATSQPIYLTSDLQSQVGTLEVATAVKVLESTDNAEKVELTLWKKSEEPNEVWYEKFGLNILSTTFNDATFFQNEDNFSILETKQDPETNTEWQKVKAVVWVKKGSLNASNETAWEQAKTMYQENCGACHDLPKEAQNNANDWPEVFQEMVDFTEFNEEEQKLIIKYLQFHSSDFNKE